MPNLPSYVSVCLMDHRFWKMKMMGNSWKNYLKKFTSKMESAMHVELHKICATILLTTKCKLYSLSIQETLFKKMKKKMYHDKSLCIIRRRNKINRTINYLLFWSLNVLCSIHPK